MVGADGPHRLGGHRGSMGAAVDGNAAIEHPAGTHGRTKKCSLHQRTGT